MTPFPLSQKREGTQSVPSYGVQENAPPGQNLSRQSRKMLTSQIVRLLPLIEEVKGLVDIEVTEKVKIAKGSNPYKVLENVSSSQQDSLHQKPYSNTVTKYAMKSSRQQDSLHQKPSKKKLISLGIRLIVTFLLFAFLFKSFSWTTVWMMLTHIHRAVALVGLIVGFCTLVVSAYQWQSLLNTEKIFVDLTRLINLYIVGIAFNQFLPTSMGGDVVKAYYVGQSSKNSPGSASAVMMARITGFFGMILVALPALFMWKAYFTQQVTFWMVAGSILVLAAIGTFFCLARIFPRLVQSMSNRGALARMMPRIVQEKVARSSIFVKGMQIGLALSKSVSHPSSMIVAILFGILFHITACLNYYAYGLALHIDVPLHFYFVAIPLISLIAFLPISVNGFGVRESSLVYLFSTAHVAVTTSLLLALTMDLQMFIFAAFGACIYFFMGIRQKQKQKRQIDQQILTQSTVHTHCIPS